MTSHCFVDREPGLDRLRSVWRSFPEGHDLIGTYPGGPGNRPREGGQVHLLNDLLDGHSLLLVDNAPTRDSERVANPGKTCETRDRRRKTSRERESSSHLCSLTGCWSLSPICRPSSLRESLRLTAPGSPHTFQSPTDSRHGNCRVCRLGGPSAFAAAGRSEPHGLQPTHPSLHHRNSA